MTTTGLVPLLLCLALSLPATLAWSPVNRQPPASAASSPLLQKSRPFSPIAASSSTPTDTRSSSSSTTCRYSATATSSSSSEPDVGVDVDDQSSPSARSSAAHLVFPGGGIFFYWQAGVVTYLREAGYDLSQVSMSGASAGALTATLAANDVCFEDATELALRLAEEAGVWDRKEGLQGVWGPLIERWLDELLPDDAHVASSERLSLLVTPVPSLGKTRVSHFKDKDDLIRCNMASVHLPWFLDGKWTSTFRDQAHIDGSFLSKDHHYVPEESRAQQRAIITLDWTEDPGMATEFGDFVKLVSKDGIYGMLNQGKTYAAEVLEKRGDFKELPRL